MRIVAIARIRRETLFLFQKTYLKSGHALFAARAHDLLFVIGNRTTLLFTLLLCLQKFLCHSLKSIDTGPTKRPPSPLTFCTWTLFDLMIIKWRVKQFVMGDLVNLLQAEFYFCIYSLAARLSPKKFFRMNDNHKNIQLHFLWSDHILFAESATYQNHKCGSVHQFSKSELYDVMTSSSLAHSIGKSFDPFSAVCRGR